MVLPMGLLGPEANAVRYRAGRHDLRERRPDMSAMPVNRTDAPPMDPVEDKLLTLQMAVSEYLSECDNPIPDYALRRQLRDRLRVLVGAPTQPER